MRELEIHFKWLKLAERSLFYFRVVSKGGLSNAPPSLFLNIGISPPPPSLREHPIFAAVVSSAEKNMAGETRARAAITPGGGGGVLNKVLYGKAPPRGPSPYPFMCHF